MNSSKTCTYDYDSNESETIHMYALTITHNFVFVTQGKLDMVLLKADITH